MKRTKTLRRVNSPRISNSLANVSYRPFIPFTSFHHIVTARIPQTRTLDSKTYQIFTRSAGARYILSPGFTLNVVSNTSLFTRGTKAR